MDHINSAIKRLLTAAAVILTPVFAANTFSAELATAKIPVRVNVAATVSAAPSVGAKGGAASKSVAANAWDTLTILFAKGDPFEDYIENRPPQVLSTLRGQRGIGAGAMIRQGRGNITLNLRAEQYDNAAVALYTVNGKRVLSGRGAAARGAFNLSSANIPAGIYLLSVKGTNRRGGGLSPGEGGSFTSRLSHKGGRININVAFANAAPRSVREAAEAVYGETWGVTASASGHYPAEIAFVPREGENDPIEITLKARSAKENFTETITFIDRPGSSVSFDMIYVRGGTFTLGCDPAVRDSCPADARPVAGVTVSDYFIGAVEVTTNLWRAVMGGEPSSSGGNSGYGSMTWYDAQEFACKLSERTGRNYRMQTEAEFEFAAKQGAALGMGGLGGTEEWAYNTWSITHSTVTQDPIGPGGPIHNQKTRRDAAGTRISDGHITGRLIRSIEGTGPRLRLVISADMDYPPGMVSPCKIITPVIDDGIEVNSYRDRRWITGDHYEWAGGFADMIIKVWDDGAVRMGMVWNGQLQTSSQFGGASGEWYTVNNFAFKIAMSPTSETRTKFAYIFISPDEVSIIPESGNAVGRFLRRPATITVNKPSGHPGTPVTQLLQLPEDQMWDMSDIPQQARGQDPRLFDRTDADPTGLNTGWFQNNCEAGGSHHYRKDVDPDEFRFTVGSGILANGSWFTVNNTFLRVTYNGPPSICMRPPCPDITYVADYLYTVSGTDNPSFYHNSFMGYERGDFRVFRKVANGSDTFYSCPAGTGQQPCGNACANEIPKGQAGSMYSSRTDGHSTYVPPRCPSGGCR